MPDIASFMASILGKSTAAAPDPYSDLGPGEWFTTDIPAPTIGPEAPNSLAGQLGANDIGVSQKELIEALISRIQNNGLPPAAPAPGQKIPFGLGG
jgi:hypothetical protein